MTVELLTLVAIWCGTPMIGEFSDGYTKPARILRTHQQVDECRAEMISCLELKIAPDECAKQVKLNK